MATSHRIFSSVDLLRKFQATRLLRFLTRYKDYFTLRGYALPTPPTPKEVAPQEKSNEPADPASEPTIVFEYDKLTQILVDPDEATPADLIHELCLIDELNNDFDVSCIVDELKVGKLELCGEQELTNPDIILETLLRYPQVVQKIHAKKLFEKTKSFKQYKIPEIAIKNFHEPSPEELGALETKFTESFAAQKKGRICKILYFNQTPYHLFLIRHGRAFSRQETVNAQNQPSQIRFRPIQYDLVMIEGDMMSINASTTADRKSYSGGFCEMLYNTNLSPADFDQYTLRPIIANNKRCLLFHDVPDIESIDLVELSLTVVGPHTLGFVIKGAKRVFDGLSNLLVVYQSDELLLQKATFKFKRRGCEQTQSLIIQPPDKLSLSQENSRDVIDSWMKNRGFFTTSL